MFVTIKLLHIAHINKNKMMLVKILFGWGGACSVIFDFAEENAFLFFVYFWCVGFENDFRVLAVFRFGA